MKIRNVSKIAAVCFVVAIAGAGCTVPADSDGQESATQQAEQALNTTTTIEVKTPYWEDIPTIKSVVYDNLLRYNFREVRHADVTIAYPESENTKELVVRLFDRETWYYDTNVITLQDNAIVSIAKNVRRIDLDKLRAMLLHAKCPDPTVDAVFATLHYSASGGDPIATAKGGVDSAIASAVNRRGYNVKLLADKDATLENYINWMSCTRVKAFGNIGHGNTNGIALYDGDLTSDWFENLPDNFLSKQVIYFNSCQVHNNPLLGAVESAGTRTFIGGIPNLLIGDSEDVFKCFWDTVFGMRRPGSLFLVLSGPTMGSSLATCEQNNYPTVGAHGLTGSSGPFWSRIIAPLPTVQPL